MTSSVEIQFPFYLKQYGSNLTIDLSYIKNLPILQKKTTKLVVNFLRYRVYKNLTRIKNFLLFYFINI